MHTTVDDLCMVQLSNCLVHIVYNLNPIYRVGQNRVYTLYMT